MPSPILTEMIRGRSPRPRGGPEVQPTSPTAHAAEAQNEGTEPHEHRAEAHGRVSVRQVPNPTGKERHVDEHQAAG